MKSTCSSDSPVTSISTATAAATAPPLTLPPATLPTSLTHGTIVPAVTYANIGDDYTLFTVKNSDSQTRALQNIVHYIVVDNSGSMRGNTKIAVDTLGHGLIAMRHPSLKIMPATVMLFDTNVVTFEDVTAANFASKIRYPAQGGTNITIAIQTAIATIMSCDNQTNHYILTFLSDGQHLNGDPLTNENVRTMHDTLVAMGIKLSIIIVGISHASDTTLAMKIKSIETVPLLEIDSIYFTQTQHQMTTTLARLIQGCISSLCNSVVVNVKVLDGVFFDTRASEANISLNSDEAYYLLVKHTVPAADSAVSTLIINDVQYTATPKELLIEDINKVVESFLPKLSQQRIANGASSISDQVQLLNNFIDKTEAMLARVRAPGGAHLDAESIGVTKLSGIDRVNLLKTLHKSTHYFREIRNKLTLLYASVNSSSAAQAEYLTGINRKYGAKATIKSGITDSTYASALAELRTLMPELKAALLLDAEKPQPDTVSILSLNTFIEQLQDIVDSAEMLPGDDAGADENLYRLLICFGVVGYSVKFKHTNAVQMDPFQTACTYLECCPVDTCSVMLANQVKRTLYSPSREQITDVLILNEPCVSTTMQVFTQSTLYKHLCSVALCRDLYMYHPKMTFSMHAHALQKALSNFRETRSEAYMILALKIVYSIRKFWRECNQEDNNALFNHWWNDLESITQSAKDNCNHPIQLLLMLCAYTVPGMYNNTVALVNLVNEVLARDLKQRLIRLTPASTSDTEKSYRRQCAVNMLHRMYNIVADSCPKPHPELLTEEPTVAAVRESCARWVDFATVDESWVCSKLNISSIDEYITVTAQPYVDMYAFALRVQEFGVVPLMEDLDRGISTTAIAYFTSSFNTKSYFEYIGVYSTGGAAGAGAGASTNVAKYCTFSQALLCHESTTRSQITDYDVFNNETFAEILVDLQMEHYSAACRAKKAVWQNSIGAVTEASALRGDVDMFTHLVGQHTHGHSSEEFWGLLYGALDNADKLEVFKKKSNSTVQQCIDKATASSKTKKRR